MNSGITSSSWFRRWCGRVVMVWILFQTMTLAAQTSSPANAQAPVTSSTPASTGNAALPSSLPLRRDAETLLGTEGMGVFRAFALVMLLAAGSAWMLKRYLRARQTNSHASYNDWRDWLTPTGKQDGFQVIQSKRLSSGVSFHLIHWDGKEWLVGCTEHGLQVLGQRQTEHPETKDASKGEA